LIIKSGILIFIVVDSLCKDLDEEDSSTSGLLNFIDSIILLKINFIASNRFPLSFLIFLDAQVSTSVCLKLLLLLEEDRAIVFIQIN